jgi:predicted permease
MLATRPPALAARLLAFAFDDEDFADSILGDLAEERAARLARGARFDGLWYWREVVWIALRASLSRARRRSSVRVRFRGYLMDVSRGLRTASRQRVLLASSALAIALGIAPPATIFSIVRGLSRDLPFPHGDRIVYVTRQNRATGERDLGLTSDLALGIAREQHSLTDVAEFVDRSVSLGADDGPAQPLRGARISASAFSVLGVTPLVGAAFTEDDAHRDADVALISAALWRSRFGGSADVLGRTIRLDARPTRIVGVMRPDFRFPFKDDIWQPLALRPGIGGQDSLVKAFGRLAPNVSVSSADAAIGAIAARIEREQPRPDQHIVARVLSFKESQLEPEDFVLFRAMILVVSTVLLVACANVANLFLAHVTTRAPLFAVKSALGASRATVVRELIAETALASLLGGTGGVLLATAAVHWFNESVSDAIPAFWMSISIDFGVLAFSAALVILATFAAGIAPALHAARATPAAALREERGTVASRRSLRLARVLLTAEVAISCGLLIVAGIMVKGVFHGARAPIAVDASKITTAELHLDALRSDAARVKFVDEAMSRVRLDPRLAGIAFTTVLPGRAGAPIRVGIGSLTDERSGALPSSRLAVVSPSYFELLHVRPVAGRLFDNRDATGQPKTALVNRTFARRHFPGLSEAAVLTERVQLHADGDSAWVDIVGVVPDFSVVTVDSEVVELMMIPFAQHPVASGSLLTTGPSSDATVVQATRDLIRTISPDVAASRFESLIDAFQRSRRASWSLASVFAQCGLAGLLLGAIGVYGVAATTSGRRIREMAIRRALGASALEAALLLFRESAVPVVLGVLIGSGLALRIAPKLGGLLFGESPHDASVFALVSLVLLVVMALAGGRPAVRVARASLAKTLREG